MQRIEGHVAASLGDVSRPLQTQADRRLQKEALDAQEQKEEASKEIGSDELQAAAAELKQVIEVSSGKRLDFGIEEQGEGLFVVIKEHGSDQVIKQIPSEEILDLHGRIEKIIGVILDEKA